MSNKMPYWVTCPSCKSKLAALNGTRADYIYNVGNPAHGNMGHQTYFTPTGRIALCIAELQDK